MDPVSAYLHRHGQPVQPEYFLGSHYLLGQRLACRSFQLTYRLDGNRLILCDFRAVSHDGLAVQSLRTLMHRIMAEVEAVHTVDAMIFVEEPDPLLAQQRQRLVRLMQQEGAETVLMDGAPWLRITCRKEGRDD
ncbi:MULTISPECIES: hypothetical protein [unclassified Paludibacterium]|uniref:hypothetical protein n=1 Tax=unclassified Paludibacterium TaxID=2618429 RepID=UPI001C042454|nr:hypothetical protein [Paludibacterium sp. B53371]BEV73221.1 hypothetical protein THUN1379_27030 [Paludibacterium sp. THUN1379]